MVNCIVRCAKGGKPNWAEFIFPHRSLLSVLMPRHDHRRWICRTLNETPNASNHVLRILTPDTNPMGRFRILYGVIIVGTFIKCPVYPSDPLIDLDPARLRKRFETFWVHRCMIHIFHQQTTVVYLFELIRRISIPRNVMLKVPRSDVKINTQWPNIRTNSRHIRRQRASFCGLFFQLQKGNRRLPYLNR